MFCDFDNGYVGTDDTTNFEFSYYYDDSDNNTIPTVLTTTRSMEMKTIK